MSRIGKYTVERRYHRLCTEPNGNFKSLFSEEADGQMSVLPEETEDDDEVYDPYPFNPYSDNYCDDNEGESSPNFLRRISYGGAATAVALAIIPIFLIGYVLFRCIEEVVSDKE